MGFVRRATAVTSIPRPETTVTARSESLNRQAVIKSVYTQCAEEPPNTPKKVRERGGERGREGERERASFTSREEGREGGVIKGRKGKVSFSTRLPLGNYVSNYTRSNL